MLKNYPLEAFWVHFPGYVQQSPCSTNACSTNPVFNNFYVQQALCSTHPCSTKLMLNKLHVQRTLCSTNPMFNKPCVQEIWVRQTLCSTPVGLVTRTLYVLHRSRAFHEVWCLKVIGRDSWVRETTGVSVQRIPHKKLVVVRKRFAL